MLTVDQNLFQLTYACTVPSLSDTNVYPTVRMREVAFHAFVVSGLGRRQHRLKRASVAASFSCRVVQFVRSLSPSTSYAPAVVGLASKYGWSRLCILGFPSLTTTKWSSALRQELVTVAEKYVSPLLFNSLRKSSVSSIKTLLAEIADERLRVVLVLAPPVYVRNVAVAADSLQLIRTGWAWITDSAAQKIDFTGDAPDVREILTSVSCRA